MENPDQQHHMHAMRAPILLTLLVLVLALPAGAVTQDQLERQFRDVVFGFNDNDKGGNRSGRITRWTGEPPKVFIGRHPDGIGDAQLPLIADAIARIRRATGLAIEATDTQADMTAAVFIIPRWGFKKATEHYLSPRVPHLSMNPSDGGSMCRGIVLSDSEHRYFSGLILLPDDAEDWVRERCAYEETFQMMGAAADACHYRPSIFCEKDTWERSPPWLRPTEADEFLLSVLYDGRIEDGMTEAEAMPQVRAIIRERWPVQ